MAYRKTKNEETIQKTVRIPKNTFDRIQEDADKYERDVSKQIIFILKKYYDIADNVNK